MITPTPANDNNQRPAEFDAAVMQWLPLLRKLAARFESKTQERDDLVQETVAVALHRWASYNPTGKLSGWLVFQMRERCRELRRKRGVLHYGLRDELGEHGKAVDWATVAPQQEAALELTQVVDAIPARYRSLMARLAVGYEQQEIAVDEGVSRQAIHQRVNACRAQLRKVAA